MKKVIQRSNERGRIKRGWLDARFSFSFAEYYNPSRLGFGPLIVLNNDVISQQSGFETHPHHDMEIITIVLNGTLTHKDTLGSKGTISPGEVQVMSAGSGIFHSEKNLTDKPVELFQIWIHPKKLQLEPRYETKKFDLGKNKLNLLVSEESSPEGLYINQDAKIFRGVYSGEESFEYKLDSGKGIFVIVIKGEMNVEGEILKEKDSIEISQTSKINFDIIKKSDFLIIEVPLE